MSDNLRITTPLTPNESLNRVRTSTEVDPLATIDPSRVLSKDANSQNANKSNLEFAWNRNSVFNAFAQKLQQTPALSQTLQKLLTGAVLQNESAEFGKLSEAQANSFEVLISKLANEIQMDDSKILENLMFQQKNSTSFNSNLFKLLRNISKATDSNSVAKDYIGRFLKAYDGYFSSSNTMLGIISQLKDIVVRIPKAYREEIHNQMGEMIQDGNQEALKENLQILKERILPLLGKYVSSSNDMSETRERITLLVNDISRLNISTKEEVVERFSELIEYCKYSLNVESDKIELLNRLFVKDMQTHDEPQNELISALMDVLKNSSSQKLTKSSQTMLKDITTSFLLDKSVFMPFHHFVLPVQYNGAFMFSEIWVEKDSPKKSRNNDINNNTRRVFLSFDIQDIGRIQAVIGLSDDKMINCRIALPESLSEEDRNIKKNITNIFTNNGFTVNSVSSLPENFEVKDEIVQTIYDGRSSINVSI